MRETVENVGRATQPVTDTVQQTVGGANGDGRNASASKATVDDDTTDTDATQPVQDTVDDVVDTVEGTTGRGLPLP